jgi:hypothetical protein
MRDLMSFTFFSQVAGANDRLHDVADMSADAGKRVYDAYMYIPNTAVKLSGEVIVSAKEFVFAFTNVSYKSFTVVVVLYTIYTVSIKDVSLPRTTEVLFTLSLTFPVSKHCKVQFEG